MDSINQDIVKILQKNGRISIKELSELVSLTPPAVSERVRKLEKDGIITGYKAILDYEKLGNTIKVLINVSVKSNKHSEFLKLIKKYSNISECHHVTGPYSMNIKASFNKPSELEQFIGQIQHFGNTETLIILSSPIE